MAIGLARSAKLSIPKVNQNPRINQARAVPQAPKVKLANAVAATSPHTAATTTARASNAVPATQSQPTDPLASTASTPAAQSSGGTFAAPSFTPQQGQDDPRDATYWSNIAKLQFNDEQKYAENLREQTRADSDYSDALQTALRNRGAQQRELGENAIRGNLGASGWLNRTEGDQTSQYTQERAHAQLSKDQEDQARAAIRAGLIQGFSLEAATELGAAAGRLAERRREEAREAAPEAAPQAAAPGPSGDAPTGSAAGNFPFYPNPGSLPKNQDKNPAKQALSNRKKAR